MDVRNFTEEYDELINEHEAVLHKAREHQGKQPSDRKAIYTAYEKFIQASRACQDNRGCTVLDSPFLPPAYLPCSLSPSELRPITIDELRLGTHHRGAYLLLESVTPPHRSTAIIALMRDENEHGALLHLYHQEEENICPADNIVTDHTILLIKEPYYKLMDNGDYGLRVDHPSDIVHLKHIDNRVPKLFKPEKPEIQLPAGLLKNQGDSHMEEEKYWKAIEKYSDALDQPATIEQIEDIKSNRSLAFLKTQQYDAALADVGYPDFASNLSWQALFGAAEALYNLDRFSDCYATLELVLSRFPQCAPASELFGRAIFRCLEQETGEYNFRELQKQAINLKPPQLDFATYIGLVEVRQSLSKGRGLFVIKAVKAGDLLLCEKAFSRAHHDDESIRRMDYKCSSKIRLFINPRTGQALSGARAELIDTIVQKLRRNPSFASAFAALHRGYYDKTSMSTIDVKKPIVDKFLVERIISLNCFGCPKSSLDSLNSRNNTNAPRDEIGCYHSCGVWVQASYINHSCFSNARRAFIGNMMIVRAARDMDAGTEITFWYRRPEGDSASAKKSDEMMRTQWGFTCDCNICLDIQETCEETHTDRQILLQDLSKAFDELNRARKPAEKEELTQKVESLLTTLKETYTRPALEVPRLLLWEPQLRLTRYFARERQHDKRLESAVEVLISVGFVLSGAVIPSNSSPPPPSSSSFPPTSPSSPPAPSSSFTPFAVVKWGLMIDHSLVEAFEHVRAGFISFGADENAKAADRYARTAYAISVGEDSHF